MASEDKHDNENEEAPASNEGDELLRQALSEIEPLPDPVEEIERDRDQFRALAQRAQADLVNYRRRVDDERQELQRNANASLLTKFPGRRGRLRARNRHAARRRRIGGMGGRPLARQAQPRKPCWNPRVSARSTLRASSSTPGSMKLFTTSNRLKTRTAPSSRSSETATAYMTGY